MTRLAARGIELNVEVTDSGGGPAVVLLHGFTGDTSTWEFLDLGPAFTRIRIDLIGHGSSDSAPEPARYSMGEAMEDLNAMLDQLNLGAVAVVGYSLGARVALHFALEAPERTWGLVLESVSPGIEDEKQRRTRAQSDNALADAIQRGGIEAFVDKWQAQPLFASQARLPAAVLERQRRQRLAGSPLGLANSLRGMGQGQQAYLAPFLGELGIPVQLIAGALDEQYVAHARKMTWFVPTPLLQIVPNAGHNVHLEQPEVFARVVRQYIETCRPVQE